MDIDDKKISYVREFLREYVFPRYRMIILVVICILIASSSTVYFTSMIAPAVDNLFISKDIDFLYHTSVMFFLLFLLRGIMEFGEKFYLTKLGLLVIKDLQCDCFSRVVQYDLAVFKEHAIGDITSRLTSDVTQLNQTFIENMLKFCKDFVTLVCLCGMMLMQNAKLASFSIAILALCGIPTMYVGRRVKRLTHIAFGQVGSLTGFVTQVLQGLKVIKSYCAESHEVAKARKLVDEMCSINMKATVTKSYLYPIVEGLAGLAICLSFIVGGAAVIAGESTPGVLIQFITAFAFAYKPVKNIGNLNSLIQAGIAAAERVSSIMRIEPKIVDKAGSVDIVNPRGEIKFQNVSFAYDGADSVLSGVTFSISPGEKVGIVGPTGAGKSTIINLLLRFYDATSGVITVDGKDIYSLTIGSLRRSISLVTQDLVIFNDTLRYNINYGSEVAEDSRLMEVSGGANLKNFINSLDDGLDYIVGDRGTKLSGGQKQKVSIARAMLKDAPILVLDEATSALDQTSESEVKLALDKLAEGKTTIIIAHRLSTIKDCDKIVVLDSGHVVEIGTHEELLHKMGVYAGLYAKGADSTLRSA